MMDTLFAGACIFLVVLFVVVLVWDLVFPEVVTPPDEACCVLEDKSTAVQSVEVSQPKEAKTKPVKTTKKINTHVDNLEENAHLLGKTKPKKAVKKTKKKPTK